MYEFEDETGSTLGIGIADKELEEIKEALFQLRDRYTLAGNQRGLDAVYAFLDFSTEYEKE